MGNCSTSHNNTPSPDLEEEKPPNSEGHLLILVEKALNVPEKDLASESDPYVVVEVCEREERTKSIENSTDPVWSETLDLGFVAPSASITITMKDYDPASKDDLIGSCSLQVCDLLKRPKIHMLLSEEDGSVTVHKKRNLPCELFLSANVDEFRKTCNVADPMEREQAYPSDEFAKHVMIISRGTRGDVQPFVALARGLAEQLGWMVTVCTELRWKDFVKSNANVKKGAIRFRPAGGDTAARIDGRLAKWAMRSTSELMQATMLARSEGEFFDSEPVLFYWAEQMKPDLLIFGFTLANIAMIISEKLRIPLIGFILQPTCIPSKQYSAVVPINTHWFSFFDKLEEKFTEHSFQAKMKALMENNPVTEPLNCLRKARGLKPFPTLESNTWNEIVNQNVPLAVPINEKCFGGKPADWSNNSILSDFIFLRGGGIPQLSEDLVSFIESAKQKGRPLVAMSFSSMPIERNQIMNLAITMCEQCEAKPNVIALVGNRDTSKEVLGEAVQKKADALIESSRLIEKPGAPFGLLFSYMQCIIMHGGLGTTAEALRACVPCMVTGVLLMDQRFWGQRVADLGVGPQPTHISSFHKVCVANVDEALKPDSPWAKRAKELGEQIQGLSDDGVAENVEVICNLAENAVIVDTI